MSNNTIENPPNISQIRDHGIWLLKVDGHKWSNQKQGWRRVLNAWIEPAGNILYVLFNERHQPLSFRQERYDCYLFDLETNNEIIIPPEELNERISTGAISLKEYDPTTKFRSLTVDFDNDSDEEIAAYRERLQPRNYYYETVKDWLTETD